VNSRHGVSYHSEQSAWCVISQWTVGMVCHITVNSRHVVSYHSEQSAWCVISEDGNVHTYRNNNNCKSHRNISGFPYMCTSQNLLVCHPHTYFLPSFFHFVSVTAVSCNWDCAYLRILRQNKTPERVVKFSRVAFRGLQKNRFLLPFFSQVWVIGRENVVHIMELAVTFLTEVNSKHYSEWYRRHSYKCYIKCFNQIILK